MPDDGSASAATLQTCEKGGIARDPVDLRDREYLPTLARLRDACGPHPALIKRLRDPASRYLPREQGDEGTCGGQALAALIDIQRLVARRDATPVSSRMLYEVALRRLSRERDGISLRDVIKGFYNYGACSEELWPYACDNARVLTCARAKDARGVSLGAYYRLRPNLNVYHAALHETGAVLVSAQLHEGWSAAKMRQIEREPKGQAGIVDVPKVRDWDHGLNQECHAFVIVGYNRDGFLVLNSWGREWGNFIVRRAPVPGLALWRYADWAEHVVDGWVLRLGVGAAEAFDFTIGDHGLWKGADTPVRSTPVHAILGNYLHTDDGEFVANGAYPSTRETMLETFKCLRDDAGERKRYKGLLWNFGGALLGLNDAAAQIARTKRIAEEAGWFPVTMLWCVDYVEQSKAVLDGVFAEAAKQIDTPGPELDRLIEARAHGVGRAFWRDIEAAAKACSSRNGPFRFFAACCVDHAARVPGFGLRIMTESEGAFALARLLEALQAGALSGSAIDKLRTAFFEMLQSVDIVAPPMTEKEYSALEKKIVTGWGEARSDRPIRLHLPGPILQRRLAVPPYTRPYVDLVARSFQKRAPGDPPDGIGWQGKVRARRCKIRLHKSQSPCGTGPIRQRDMLYGPATVERFRTVLDLPPEKKPPEKGS